MSFLQDHPVYVLFFFNDTATTEIYTLSLHDALPIWPAASITSWNDSTPRARVTWPPFTVARSEEHTSELQSQFHLVCRLLLEKKKKTDRRANRTVARSMSVHTAFRES